MTRLNEKEIKKIVKLKIHNLVVNMIARFLLAYKEKLNFSNKYYIQKIKDCLDIKKDKKGVDICFEDATRTSRENLSNT